MKSLELINERIESTLKAEDKLKMELQLCFYKDEANCIKQDLERLADIDKPCKLNYEGDGYDPTTGELVYDTAICPCGREFEIDYDEHCDYCPSCGRKLDWSECE